MNAVGTPGMAVCLDDDPLVAARLSAQLGALIEQQSASRRKLLKSASKAFDEVAQSPAWWKAGRTDA